MEMPVFSITVFNMIQGTKTSSDKEFLKCDGLWECFLDTLIISVELFNNSNNDFI